MTTRILTLAPPLLLIALATGCSRSSSSTEGASSATTGATSASAPPSASNTPSATTLATTQPTSGAPDAPAEMQAAWEAFLKPMSDAKGLSTLLPLEQRHVKDAWYFLARAPLPADVVAKLKAQGERGETLAKFDVHSYVVRKVSAGATTDRWFKDIALFGAPIASFGEAANRNAAVFQLRSLSGDDSTLVMVEGQGGAMGALYYEEPVDVASGWLDGGTAVVGVRTASSNAIYAFASGAFRNVHESKSLPVLRASCTDPTKAFSATDDCDWGVTGDVRGKDPSTFEFIEYSVPAGVSGLCATVAKRCRFEATSYTYDGTKQRFVRKAGESPKTVDHELRIVHRRSAAKK